MTKRTTGRHLWAFPLSWTNGGNTVGVAEKDFDHPDTPLKGYEPIAELLKH